jgi:hypothetical protein
MRKGGRLKMPRPGEETRLFIRLYLDEDIFKDVARALRLRGFDAVSVHELSRQGLSDADHLGYAASEDRALFTFNAPDYLDLHIEYLREGKLHSGIVVSRQMPIGEVVRRLLGLLNAVTADEMRSQFWWLEG